LLSDTLDLPPGFLNQGDAMGQTLLFGFSTALAGHKNLIQPVDQYMSDKSCLFIGCTASEKYIFNQLGQIFGRKQFHKMFLLLNIIQDSQKARHIYKVRMNTGNSVVVTRKWEK
jgi:hypothetical protein